MADSERRTRGKKLFDEVYGGIVPYPAPDKQGDFLFNTIDQLFAEVWSRTTMSIRDRRLVLIGAIAAQGEIETLEIQLRAALHKGELTPDEVREIVVLLPHYIGYPKAGKILVMTQRILPDYEQKAAE
jgi:4-carboxymuconolactone decarboxylase